jgi:hypothetical protein
MISEGIAEYFGSMYGDALRVNIDDSAWDRYADIEEFAYESVRTFFFYQGGDAIVRPILEARGVRDGLLWILHNELRIELPNVAMAKEYRARGVNVFKETAVHKEHKSALLKSAFPGIEDADVNLWLTGFDHSPLSSYLVLQDLTNARRADDALDFSYLDEWLYLIDKGVPLSVLEEIDEWHLIPIKDQFESGMAPDILLTMMRGKRYEVARELARLDPDYERGVEWNRAHIKDKLAERAHLSRSASSDEIDYTESSSNIDTIVDKALVQLVKRFVDYVESPQGKAELSTLLRQGGGEETGGVLTWNGSSITVLPVVNTHTGDRTNGWLPPMVHAYGSALGIVHTHPHTEGVDPELLAGPSGLADRYTPENGNDMMTFRYYSRMGNPYTVHMVVTDVSDTEYNVDIYFRDLVERPGSPDRVTPARTITVLDLGVFEKVP